MNNRSQRLLMVMNSKAQIRLKFSNIKRREKRNQRRKNKRKTANSMSSFLKSIQIHFGLDSLPTVLIKKVISLSVSSFVWQMA